MNGTHGVTPRPIEATRMLLGEGVEEELFLNALLKHLGISGMQVENYGGKNNLAPFLKALKNRSGFVQVQKLGILRDADDNPAGAAASVDGAIAQAAFGEELTVKKLILPGGMNTGALENLCLQSITGHAIEKCVEDYMSCAAQATGHAHATTTNKAKARIHAWLAAQEKPDLRLGHAAAGGLIDWSSPAFAPLKSFLQELA
jgi:predicted ATP-dependent endonuclease of OLD family